MSSASMQLPLRLRQLAHHGSVVAAGVVVDAAFPSAAAARDRVLSVAAHARAVLRLDAAYLVLFHAGVRVDCDTCIGVPLVTYQRVLSAAPLAAAEVAGLSAMLPAGGDLVALVASGEVSAYPIASLAPVDLATWLDVSNYEILPVTTLGVVQTVAVLVAAAGSGAEKSDAEKSDDVRAALGMAALGAEGKAVAAALANAAAKHREQGSTTGRTSWLGRGAQWLAGMASGLASAVGQLFKGNAGEGKPTARKLGDGSDQAQTALQTASQAPSLTRRLRQAWHRLKVKAAVWSGLASMLGRAQANYLAGLMVMFDENQLDEALRKAVPLGKDGHHDDLQHALGTPTPRSELAITRPSGAGGTGIGVGGELFEALRARYRRAFEKLAAQGDIQKAAFVLAELLGAYEEAVAFLEKHGCLRQAAEIAEAHELPPGLVVRLWFLVGERDRAIFIARRSGAFADAVMRLQQSHPDEAAALRVLWADALASSGDYAAAVDAVWPVPWARHFAMAWIDRAVAVGGAPGAKMLVRKVRLLPERFDEVLSEVQTILADDSDEGERATWALAKALVGTATKQGQPRDDATAETRLLAKVCVRRFMRGIGGLERQHESAALTTQLLTASGDAALRADAKLLPVGAGARHATTAPIRIEAQARKHRGKQRAFNEDDVLMEVLDASGALSGHGGINRDGDGYVLSLASTLDQGRKPLGVVLGVLDGDAGRTNQTFRGDRASKLAAETVHRHLAREFAAFGGDVDEWARTLVDAMELANGRIIADAAPTKSSHCATATIATLCGDSLLLAHIGDTSAYVFRNITGQVCLVSSSVEPTTDVEPATPHTWALGVKAPGSITLTRVKLQRGDLVFLCTNGVLAEFSLPPTELLVKPDSSLAVVADALLAKVLATPARDNLAFVLARVDGDGLPPARGLPIEHGPFSPAPRREGARAVSLATRAEPLRLAFAAADHGAMPVHDAALLPDGRLLVALGELGTQMLGRDGRVQTRFAQPATRIIMSDHGDRALLLARRGESWRIARLDVAQNTVRPWHDAQLDAFAESYDGATWFVGRDGAVDAIDAVSDKWQSTWRIAEKAHVASIVRDAGTLSIWFYRNLGEGDVWTYELPVLRLRQRKDAGGMYEDEAATAANGALARSSFHPSINSSRAQVYVENRWEYLTLASPRALGAPYISSEWVAFGARDDHGASVSLFDLRAQTLRATVALAGTTIVRVRIQGDHLIICDDRGRVLVLSLRNGTILRDLRLAAA